MIKTLMIIYYIGTFGGSASGTMSSQIVTMDECQLISKESEVDYWKVYCYPMEVNHE